MAAVALGFKAAVVFFGLKGPFALVALGFALSFCLTTGLSPVLVSVERKEKIIGGWRGTKAHDTRNEKIYRNCKHPVRKPSFEQVGRPSWPARR